MSVFIPVSTLVRLVLWLAAAGVVLGVLLGAQAPVSREPAGGGPAPTSAAHPAERPAVEAAPADGR